MYAVLPVCFVVFVFCFCYGLLILILFPATALVPSCCFRFLFLFFPPLLWFHHGILKFNFAISAFMFVMILQNFTVQNNIIHTIMATIKSGWLEKQGKLLFIICMHFFDCTHTHTHIHTQ